MKDIFSDDLLNSIDGAIDQTLTVRTHVVGDVIGSRFQVERIVGRGNFGYVYRVKELATAKTRAVKIFYERFTRRPGAAARLREHGEKLSRNAHANMVRVYEVAEDAGQLFFVEEFVSALTLDKLVAAVRNHAAETGFPPDQMSDLMRQVCGLLRERPDLPHFGLHPQNIFMSKQGVKVADLGIAGALRPSLTEKDFAVMSGQRFWAPEFRKNGAMTAAADVYSLGRLLQYILTLGEFGSPGEPATVRGPHPRRLLDLARSAADADPDLRPSSADAFYASFEMAWRPEPAEAAAPAAAPEELTEEDRLAAAAEMAMDAVSERAIHQVAEAGAERPAAAEADGGLLPVEKDFFGATPAAAPAAAAKKPAAPARVEAAKAPRPNYIAWIAAAVVVLALGGVYLWRANVATPTLPVPPPAPVAPAPAPAPADANAFKLDSVNIMPERGGPTFQETLEAMLTQADTYFKENHITDPPEESAYGIYTLVLDLDPKNVAALGGLKKIENHYLTLGRGLLKNKKYDKAEWSFRKTLFINADNAEAKRGLAEVEKFEKKHPELTQVAKTGNTNPAVVPPTGTEPPPAAPLKHVTADDIKTTINSYMGRVKFCFAKNPDSKGVVTVRFKINPDGSVSDAAVAESSIGNAEIEQCLMRRVSLMRFQPFEGAAKTITLPFRFNE